MANLSLLEQAAEVREKARRVRELCADLRQKKRDGWTRFEMSVDVAHRIATNALTESWEMLDYIERMVEAHAKTTDVPKEQANG